MKTGNVGQASIDKQEWSTPRTHGGTLPRRNRLGGTYTRR
jgi:hypothetical protein